MLGASIGHGLIIYQVGRSGKGQGLARIEMGRSKFRFSSSPPYIPVVASSLHYFFILEAPFSVRLSALLGFTRFDSDEDDETEVNHVYTFDWKPQVRKNVQQWVCMHHDLGQLDRGSKGLLTEENVCLHYGIMHVVQPKRGPRVIPMASVGGRG